MKRLINNRDARQRKARHETIGYNPVYRVAKSHVVFFGLLFALLLTSCQTEKKLAKKYLAERPNIEAAVYFPEKADVKVEYNTQLGKQTEVLNGFNQDLFLDVMYNAYAQGMGDYGVNVYIPQDIDKVPVDSTHWLVMLSRTEISGRITEYEDYLFSDTDEYSYKHPLNTVNVASWFEVNDGDWKPFCSASIISWMASIQKRISISGKTRSSIIILLILLNLKMFTTTQFILVSFMQHIRTTT